jgi:hypothetical protein
LITTVSLPQRTPKRHKGGKHAHLLPAEKDIHADLQSFERNGA